MQENTERLNMKLLKTDKNALKKIAKVQGESMSVIIRRMIRKGLVEYEEAHNQNNYSQ